MPFSTAAWIAALISAIFPRLVCFPIVSSVTSVGIPSKSRWQFAQIRNSFRTAAVIPAPCSARNASRIPPYSCSISSSAPRSNRSRYSCPLIRTSGFAAGAFFSSVFTMFSLIFLSSLSFVQIRKKSRKAEGPPAFLSLSR